METLTTIVTALDFSDMSREVLRVAARLAGTAPNARILAVHVLPDPLEQPWTIEGFAVDYTHLEDAWRADAVRRLDALAADAGVPAGMMTPVMLKGRAAEAITAYAAERQADVIVMGTHGYGPVRRFILGSVAEQVLRRAPCPVLTVPCRGLLDHPAAAA